MAALRVVVAGRAGAVVVVSPGSSVVAAGSVADAAEESGGPAGSDWPEEGLSGWATASQMAALLADECGRSAGEDTWVKYTWREALSGGGVVLAEPEHYMTLR